MTLILSRANADLPGSNNTPISSDEIIDRMIFFIVQSLLETLGITDTHRHRNRHGHIIKANFPSRGQICGQV